MKNVKATSTTVMAVVWVATLANCTPGSNSVNDVNDQIEKALDPAPNYVDPPAAEPQKPQ